MGLVMRGRSFSCMWWFSNFPADYMSFACAIFVKAWYKKRVLMHLNAILLVEYWWNVVSMIDVCWDGAPKGLKKKMFNFLLHVGYEVFLCICEVMRGAHMNG